MSKIMNLKKLNNNCIFENVIVFLFIVFGIIGWKYNYLIAAIPVIIISLVLLFLFNDFKYIIPASLVLLFSYGKGYVIEETPYDIIIPVIIFVIGIIVYTVMNFKISKFKELKSYKGMLILSIGFIIPIFWSTLITNENSIYYVMYFSWALYTLLFILICININRDSFRMIVYSFSWLTILICYELSAKLYECHLSNTAQNLFSFWYYIGWGLCNEAGIILCFIMPFIFYELYKASTLKLSFLYIAKLMMLIIGLLITNSRGALLFGGLEFFALFVALFVLKNENRYIKIMTIVILSIIGLYCLVIITDNQIFVDIWENTFSVKFDDLGRTDFWKSGFASWSENARNVIFGSGIVSEIRNLNLFRGWSDTFVVYHSTFFEVLVSAGLIGIIGLVIHFIEKYKLIMGKDKSLLVIFFIGFLVLDLYGLIDNTYGMYYYMVPLVITMASLSKSNNLEIFSKKYSLCNLF